MKYAPLDATQPIIEGDKLSPAMVEWLTRLRSSSQGGRNWVAYPSGHGKRTLDALYDRGLVDKRMTTHSMMGDVGEGPCRHVFIEDERWRISRHGEQRYAELAQAPKAEEG